MNTSKQKLIIFTRFPEPGETKTRLIPHLGEMGAAHLQKQMTEYTVKQARKVGCAVEIRYTGGSEMQMKNWLGSDLAYENQGDGDLGQRMNRAVESHLTKDRQHAIIIGSDCPSNSYRNIAKAFRALETHDCVIGPARDGGYYLIGLKKPQPHLFRNIDWGTEKVFKQTLYAAKDLSIFWLPQKSDVDLPQDIPAKISVIIPTLNEEEYIADTLKRIHEGFNTETIVVDGGSSDRTRGWATAAGAKVISSPPGRSFQMNAGAQQSTGTILFFLHADSTLPPSWDVQIRNMMKEPAVALGFFRFAITGDFPGRKWVEWGTNIRSSLFKRPYGDQGMFLRKKDFEALGAFPEIPILEDVMLLKKAKRKGRVCCTDTVLSTSGRRWEKLGVIRTTLVNQAVLLCAWFGADLSCLTHAYSRGGFLIRHSVDPKRKE